ncbi:hypothetical protein ACIHEI_12325 [Kitasatospora sp. NPDC051984]|uniref:acyl-CoA-like ligand-binding transcription factor n=1 Tax=Kitasatospora sp. NPDC051984 TaxID=3364059 RepID=UPI0037CA9FA8
MESARGALDPAPGRPAESLAWTRGLLRAMPDDPALRDVWHRTQHDAEPPRAPSWPPRTDLSPDSLAARTDLSPDSLAARTDLSPDSLAARLLAAAANAAMRVAVEAWAAGDTDPSGAADLAETAFRRLAGPLTDPN